MKIIIIYFYRKPCDLRRMWKYWLLSGCAQVSVAGLGLDLSPREYCLLHNPFPFWMQYWPFSVSCVLLNTNICVLTLGGCSKPWNFCPLLREALICHMGLIEITFSTKYGILIFPGWFPGSILAARYFQALRYINSKRFVEQPEPPLLLVLACAVLIA